MLTDSGQEHSASHCKILGTVSKLISMLQLVLDCKERTRKKDRGREEVRSKL